MLIELHLLQSFPVSNLNRDDIGQPKTVRFGGYPRGRISSQCLKRAARGLLPVYGLQESELGWRTKRLADAADCFRCPHRGIPRPRSHRARHAAVTAMSPTLGPLERGSA